VREAATWMPQVYEARAALEPASRGELCRIWSSALYQLGEYTEAMSILQEAVEILAETGPPDREAWARAIFGGALPLFDPDLGRALDQVQQAVRVFRDQDSQFGLGTALGMSGTILNAMGRMEEGTADLDEAIAAAERIGLTALIGSNRALRAIASLGAGDPADARRRLEDATSVPLHLEGATLCLETLAAVALAEGDTIQAATALGAAEALRERTGIQMWPTVRLVLEPEMTGLDDAAPDVQAARYEGRRMSARDVFARYLESSVAAAAA
jgi:tetratricopeptide (TPR) repeat protein